MTPRNSAKRQTTFRLPPDLIRRLDRLAERLSAERPGVEVARADVVRMLLARGLDAEERHHGKR